MSNSNSILPFNAATLKNLVDTVGITQFTSETNWYQTIGGLILQGGKTGLIATGAQIDFNVSFPKQCLGVFVTIEHTAGLSVAANLVTQDKFNIQYTGGATRSIYWFAIGV